MLISLLMAQAALATNPRAAGPSSLPAVTPDPLHGRLVSQVVRGARRLCLYGSGSHTRSLSVGRGEPCPIRYSEPDLPVPAIPSQALLSREARVNGQLVCTYSLAGRQYRASLPIYSYCPMTPVAASQPLVPLGN